MPHTKTNPVHVPEKSTVAEVQDEQALATLLLHSYHKLLLTDHYQNHASDLIMQLLKVVRSLLRGTRCYILKVTHEEQRLNCTHEDHIPELMPIEVEYQYFPAKVFKPIIAKLQTGQPVILEDLLKLNPETEVLQTIHQSYRTRSMMLFPVTVESKLVGIIGISSVEPRQWTTVEIEVMRLFRYIITGILFQDLAKDKLQKHRDFLHLILEISSSFINIAVEEVDNTITRSLQKLATFLDVQQCQLMTRDKHDPDAMSVTHEWLDDSIPSQKHLFQSFKSPPEMKFLNDMFLRMETLVVEDIDEMGPEFAMIKQMMDVTGMKCIVDVPIFYQRKYMGLVGLSTFQKGREWTAIDIGLLKFAGDLFYQSLVQRDAREEIEQSRKRYQAVVEDQTESIIRFDKNLCQQFINPAGCRLLGQSESEVIGTPFGGEIVAEDRGHVFRAIQSLTMQDPGTSIACRVQSNDDQPHWMQWVFRALFDERGELKEYQAVGRDITQLKSTEVSLTKSLEYEKLIASLSRDLINADIDEIDVLIHQNVGPIAAFLQVDMCVVIEFHQHQREAQFLRIYQEFNEPQLPEWILNGETFRIHDRPMKWFWPSLLNKEVLVIESPDDYPPHATVEKSLFGSYGIYSSVHIPMMVGDEIVGVLGVSSQKGRTWSANDIQQIELFAQTIANAIHRRRIGRELEKRMQLEQMLSHFSARFINLPLTELSTGIEEALSNVGNFLQFDRCYVYDYTDNQETAVLKHSWHRPGLAERDHLVKQFDMRPQIWVNQELLAGHTINIPNTSDLSDEHAQLRQIYIEKGIKSAFYFPVWCNNRLRGLWGMTNLSSYREMTPQDQLILSYFSSILGNILEREENDHQREFLINQLEAKNKELESFTYTVSHDLKSPLVTISGFLGVLKEDVESLDQAAIADDLREIKNAAEKMKQLLDELLNLSRIGRIANVLSAVDMHAATMEVLSLFKPQIDQRQVKIRVYPLMPTFWGDKSRIEEVIQNLVQNALRFTPREQAEIEIGMRTDFTGREIYYVKDNGIGIAPAYHERIFGLFEKLNPHDEGTGIGLAIVKKIVEWHHGSIWVESSGESALSRNQSTHGVGVNPSAVIGHLNSPGSTFCVYIPPSSSMKMAR
jgi:PAS domain S-box-containing protein